MQKRRNANPAAQYLFVPMREPQNPEKGSKSFQASNDMIVTAGSVLAVLIISVALGDSTTCPI